MTDIPILLGLILLLISLISAGFWARFTLNQNLETEALADGRLGLSSFARPYWIPLAIAVTLIILQTVLGLAAPWPLKFAVDNVIGGQPLDGWMAELNGVSKIGLAAIAALAGVILVGASSFLGYLTSYLIGAAAERIGADIRSAVFTCLQHRSLWFHDRNRTGDLVSRLTSDVSRAKDILVSWFDTLLPELFALIGMLGVLFVVDFQIALAALTVIPLLSIQIIRNRTRIRKTEREARDRYGQLATQATETLRHVRAVQAFSRENEEQRRFRRQSAAAAESALNALEIQARYSPTSDVILAVGSGFILFLGVMRVTMGQMTVGTLLVILTYLSAFYHPIRSLTRLTSVLAKAAASRERLAEIFADEEFVTEAPGAIAAPRGLCAVALENVTFAYRPETPVLRNVSLEIQAGETVCIVGSTGGGKSTLLSLLLRFYDPDDGVISMDGVDLRRFTLASIRNRIALVPQDTWILDGTIAENIRFGRMGANDAEIKTAGQLALVEEFVTRLPDGYDTIVGESGARLSGGQRRRIALARAIVRDAPILLLDEPTSGLDAGSEATIIAALQKVSQSRTVVIVSHRLKLAAIADRVIVLDAGRIIEQGEPALLLTAGGAFAHLWSEQTLRAAKPNRGTMGWKNRMSSCG